MNTESTIEPMPDELISPRAKLVYLYLTTTRRATLDELHTHLDLPKITLYTIVRTLRRRGLVDQEGETLSITT